TEQPELFWGLIVSFAIGNIMLVLLNIPTIGLWVALLRIPFSWMYPAILVFVALGVYSVNNNTFDIYMVALLGILGYELMVLRFEPTRLL
ncbi:tripartite tricarboxylate transporter permease, partial [Azospirillum brasilense]|uniref:tripartite tricarboxylate transporter permease n=1 Tax=Azospirillum brasilense TaxID=192 RepID=UPI0009D23AEF